MRGLALAGVVAAAAAQPTGLGRSPMNPTPNGPHAARPTAHAITNATVFVRPGEVLENATVRFEDGRITSVRVDGDADGAQVHDGTGLYVYAAFVDAFVEVDAPKPDA
ncbi:MAG: hypothetical protein AAFY58_07640, partial [Planctomycetota bacterium]